MVYTTVYNAEKSAEALNELYESYGERQQKKIEEQEKEMKRLREMVQAPVNRRLENQRRYSSFRENLRHDLLATAIKGIYLGALQERMILENNHLVIADNMVNGYIQEHGGADAVLRSFKDKTYILDRIRCLVEEAEEEVKDKVDKDDPDTQNIPEETKEDMHDALEKEDDVHAAIDTIAQRISTAEEEFIRQNAEDKKKMEELANKVSERLSAVKDDDEDDMGSDNDDSNTEEGSEEGTDEKDAVEQEAARILARGRSKIRDDRQRSVFEQMARTLYESIVVNESLRDEYTNENGSMDSGAVIESVICIYGFLETVNTLQMDRVDAGYIENILKDMR